MLHFLRLRALLVVLCCIAFSCDDDDDAADTTGPEITVLTPTEGSRVKGTINISVKAEDLSDEVTLQLYVDNNLIKEEDTKEIVVALDTKTLSEGPHNIEVKATDGKGNATSKSSVFEVRNTLFTVDVPSGYVGPNTIIYFVLSANDGTLLASKKVENGMRITVPTPANFNPDSSFMFTEYFHLNEAGFLVNAVNAFVGMIAGDYKLPQGELLAPVAGTHHLSLSDLPSSHEARIGGEHLNSMYGFFGSEGTIDIDLSMRNSTSDLFFSLLHHPDDAPVYNYVPTIQTGGSTSFSINGLPVMNQRSVPLNSLAESHNVLITGYQNNRNRAISVFNKYSIDPGTYLSFYFPGDIFPLYKTELSATIGQVNHTYRSTGQTPPSTFQYLDAEITNVTYANGNLSIATSGDFDIGTVGAGMSIYENNLFTIESYTVHFPQRKDKISIPQLPQEILDLGSPSLDDLEFNYASLADFDGLSGLSDYREKLVFSADGQYRFVRDGVTKGSSTVPTGGRMQAPAPEVQEKIRMLKQRFPQINWQ